MLTGSKQSELSSPKLSWSGSIPTLTHMPTLLSKSDFIIDKDKQGKPVVLGQGGSGTVRWVVRKAGLGWAGWAALRSVALCCAGLFVALWYRA